MAVDAADGRSAYSVRTSTSRCGSEVPTRIQRTAAIAVFPPPGPVVTVFVYPFSTTKCPSHGADARPISSDD